MEEFEITKLVHEAMATSKAIIHDDETTARFVNIAIAAFNSAIDQCVASEDDGSPFPKKLRPMTIEKRKQAAE